MIFLLCCSQLLSCKYRDATLNIFILPLAFVLLILFLFFFFFFGCCFCFYFLLPTNSVNSVRFASIRWRIIYFFAHLDFSDFLRFYLSVILQFKSNPPMCSMPSAMKCECMCLCVYTISSGWVTDTQVKSIAIRYSVAMLLLLLLLRTRHCFNNHYVQSTFYFHFVLLLGIFLFLLQFYHILVQIIHLLLCA